MLRIIMAMPVERDDPGDWYWALISGDEELQDSIITGADVVGMNDDDRLAAGSAIITPGTRYVAYKDEIFQVRS